MTRSRRHLRQQTVSVALLLIIASLMLASPAVAQGLVPKFALPEPTLQLARQTAAGAFFDVVGRKSAVFGYEGRPFEVWTYPLKILKDFELSFQIEDYPLDIRGSDAMARIDVRPEATILTYTHAAFTVRQIIFAPVNEPGVIMLLDIDATRPIRVIGSFRPDLKLMWPAGLMTANLGWDATANRYFLIEETQRFAGVIGAPGAVDISVMPYQEEPRDVPTRFVLDTSLEEAAANYYPIVVTGSTKGRAAAEDAYDRLLADAPHFYTENVRHYGDLLERTATVVTPDDRLNAALDWARIGVDKGFADNPDLGTGLVAGFRTSGASERPGFAWFFGRDALWTVFSLVSAGDFEGARTALDFLTRVQRDDGKVPHEISQSAAYLPWFEEYSYPWNSADATPLYIIAHADLWQASGNLEYLRENWPAIRAAYEFSRRTDTDGNRLIDNTNVGHGWVEGGELYPAHEEIYMQGLWIQASGDMAELAVAMDDMDLAQQASQAAERTRLATELTYWQEQGNYYAFATRSSDASNLYREDTVLPAVPMWWRTLDDDRGQHQVDRLGSGHLATDWGTRILSEESDLYDPLSYHNGSVWGLFTGWASMAAYRYGRPHVGYQALMANALLTRQDALGYVTELLSGQYNTAFGRSSHHQVWSDAMVYIPAVRGLLGLESTDEGRTLVFEPQVPADWDSFVVDNFHVGDQGVRIRYERTTDSVRIMLTSIDGANLPDLRVAPALPLDAQVSNVTANGRVQEAQVATVGDIQRPTIEWSPGTSAAEIVFTIEGGTDVYLMRHEAIPGDRNQGLRILRSRASAASLDLTLEGLAGHEYSLYAKSPRTVGSTSGVTVTPKADDTFEIGIQFSGSDGYVRREISLPLN